MSTIALSLHVGLQGKFELAEPFNTLIHPQYVYTVQSIQTLSDIINRGDNPKETYDNQGVDYEDYVKDLQANKSIIGLKSISGSTIYVPETFIVSMPQSSGVPYTPLVMTVGLGMLPDDQNLENLEDVIKTAVLAELGIEAQTLIVSVGSTEFVNSEEHERTKAAREAAVTSGTSQGAQLLQLKRENALLKTQLQELASYITSQ